MDLQPNRTLVVIEPKSILLVFALGILLWLAVQIREMLVLLFIAWLLASTLYPAVDWLERRQHLPKAVGIALFYILIIGLVGGLIAMMTDLMVEQATSLLENLPALSERVLGFFSHLPGLQDLNLREFFSQNVRTVAAQSRNIVLSTLTYLFMFVQGFLGLLTILILTLLMLLHSAQLENAFAGLIPPSKRQRITNFFRQACRNIGAYIRGQLIVAAAIALITWLGLVFLDVPYAGVLGLLTFVLDLIPVIGSLLAAVFAVLIALSQAPMLALWTALLYIITNQLEANVLGPLILGRTVGIGPFWIILSTITGGILAGIPGVFLAIPTAVIIKLVIDEFYLPAIEGEQSPEPIHAFHLPPEKEPPSEQ